MGEENKEWDFVQDDNINVFTYVSLFGSGEFKEQTFVYYYGLTSIHHSALHLSSYCTKILTNIMILIYRRISASTFGVGCPDYNPNHSVDGSESEDCRIPVCRRS